MCVSFGTTYEVCYLNHVCILKRLNDNNIFTYFKILITVKGGWIEFKGWLDTGMGLIDIRTISEHIFTPLLYLFPSNSIHPVIPYISFKNFLNILLNYNCN